MAKIQKISEIHLTLGFTEFDILEKYRKSFNESELGRLHSVFPFEVMAKSMGLSENRLGRRNIFSPSSKIALMILKAYTGLSDRHLVEHLNGNLHYQMFCGIIIDPAFPITNYKIVSAIRNEIASRLDIDSLQEILATHWKTISICPTVRKEKERHPGQGCSSVVCSGFLKNSSYRWMRFIESTEPHYDIRRITKNVFPSSEKF